ncbi:MAG: ATP-binding cassette domain-containing protein [Balneolaceae bacterium]
MNFSFGGEAVLNDFSFEAPRGKHTILKGESGVGKSTILKMILGFYRPDTGAVRTDLQEVNPQEIRRQSAWLPQDLDLGDGTVQEVMQKPFTFKINRLTREIDFPAVLTLLGLSQDNMRKQFRDLSTGQRQRVGLAICYLLDKPLLLLDEPTAALDRASKQRVAELLLDSDRTIISTSHDPFWVELGDNVIQLD